MSVSTANSQPGQAVVDLLPVIAALSRGDVIDPRQLAGATPEAVAALADRHGVGPLLAEHTAADPSLAWLSSALGRQSTAIAAADLVAGQALREALHALHRARVDVLVFKGAQLAYACYAAPHHRPRLDSDLLVRPDDRARAGGVLRDLGYQMAPQVDADMIMFQQMFVLGEARAPRHVIDLHWRVANPHEFGLTFDVDELIARAAPIPALGAAARGLSPSDALMVSLVHPVAHHGGAGRLIWDLDTAALVRRMTPVDWEAFLDRLDTPRLAAIAAIRLERARDWAAARIDPDILARLRQRATPEELDLLAAPATADAEWHVFVRGLRALPGWRSRLRFARQHVIPSSRYMRDVYAPGSRAPLPALYAGRACRGLLRWLRVGRRPGTTA